MPDPITPEQRLAEIRERDDRALKRAENPAFSLSPAEYDRTLVLDEVDRLNAELKIAFGPSLYLAVQQVLDSALGTGEEDGAGAGIVGDVTLVAERMQAAEAEVDRLRAGIVALDRLDRVAIGDWEREVDRLRAELAQMKAAAADWAARLTAQKDRADRSASQIRGVMRAVVRRIGELNQMRDAVADSDPIRAERLTFTVQEIRDLFKPEPAEGAVAD